MDQLCFSLVDVCVHVFPANSFAKHQIMTFKSAKLHPTQRTRFPKRKRLLAIAFSFPSGSVYWVTGGEQEMEGWVSSLFVRL